MANVGICGGQLCLQNGQAFVQDFIDTYAQVEQSKRVLEADLRSPPRNLLCFALHVEQIAAVPKRLA